jgi:catechol 2,3-dioxygenase-like lactoylglutathione lyase family enzyme
MRGRENQDASTDRWERSDWWEVTLESPDPARLLRFWSAVLDKPIYRESEEGGSIDFQEGVVGLAVQKAEIYEPPVWPPEPGKQGMQMHLEIEVSDLAAAVEHALELGARQADHQPQENVRVMLDPDGHPFCLYT